MLDESLLAYIRAERAAGTSKEAITAQLATGGWTAEEPPAASSVKIPPPAEVLPPVPATNILPILGFVREQLVAGVSKKDITDQLATGGWTTHDVGEAFAAIEKTSASQVLKPTIVPEPVSVAPEPVVVRRNLEPMSSTQTPSPVTPPAPTPSPVSEPVPFVPMPSAVPHEPQSVSRAPLIILAVLLFAILAAVAAYIFGLGPFAPVVYTLHTASTTVPAAAPASGTPAAAPVAASAAPSSPTGPEYQGDVVRLKAAAVFVRSVLKLHDIKGSYPATLAQMTTQLISINPDFKSQIPPVDSSYVYSVAHDGKDFALSVTLQTAEAVSVVTSLAGYTAAGTPVKGKTITFTKNSVPVLAVIQ